MKALEYLLVLILSSFLFPANAQLNMLSTFEEIWVVSTSFDGVDGEAFDGIDGESITQKEGFGPAKNFISFSQAGKHKVSELQKIIADTPFLSLEISSSKASESSKAGNPRISLEPHPWDSLDKMGNESYSILLKSGDSYFLFIPSANPDKLEKSLKNNGGMLKSGIAGLEQVNIESIRIENGTYLKNN